MAIINNAPIYIIVHVFSCTCACISVGHIPQSGIAPSVFSSAFCWFAYHQQWQEFLFLYIGGWQIFSVKGQTVNIETLWAIELLLQLLRPALVAQKQWEAHVSKWVWLCSNTTWFAKTVGRLCLGHGPWLPNPCSTSCPTLGTVSLFILRHFNFFLQLPEEKWDELLLRHFLFEVLCWNFSAIRLSGFCLLICNIFLYFWTDIFCPSSISHLLLSHSTTCLFVLLWCFLMCH